ncbi:hypothetical protein [Flavobacterium sp. CS20]|uniref:hypothetical protein n=1 Tax=Flavobacterium sp. CS20 TaxID=2775246 RepID=UPI001B3A3823|nr:hypothetical protein [Flavobacterium sp. CS20]QTY27652.1 hypothetical protein IGB25_03700 [Flavobacterium sp. CS20]
MLDEELEFAPKHIKNLFANLGNNFTEFLKDKDEVINLATEYIDQKIVGILSI